MSKELKDNILCLLKSAIDDDVLTSEDVVKFLKKELDIDDDVLIDNIDDLDRLTEAEGKRWLYGMSTEDAFDVIEPDFDDCLSYANDHSWNFYDDFQDWCSQDKLEELAKRLSGYVDKNGTVHFQDYLFSGEDVRDLVKSYVESPYMDEYVLRTIVSEIVGLPNYTDDQMLKDKCTELGERLAKAH